MASRWCRCCRSRADGCSLQWFGRRHAGRLRRNDGRRWSWWHDGRCRNDGRCWNDGRRRDDRRRRDGGRRWTRWSGRRGWYWWRERRRHGGQCRARRIRRRRRRWFGRHGRSGGFDLSERAAASRRSVQRAKLLLRGLRGRRADRRLLHKWRLGRRPGSVRDGDLCRDRRRRHLPGGADLLAKRRRRGSAGGVRAEWLRHRPNFLRLFAAVRGDVHRDRLGGERVLRVLQHVPATGLPVSCLGPPAGLPYEIVSTITRASADRLSLNARFQAPPHTRPRGRCARAWRA